MDKILAGLSWHTHLCVGCRDFSRHVFIGAPGVGTSADAARTSACATSVAAAAIGVDIR